MRSIAITRVAGLVLGLAVLGSTASAQLGPPIIDYLEFDTLTPHQRVSVHGVNFEQSGQIHIGGVEAFVVPIPGSNAVKMNAYIPGSVPFGQHEVTVTTSVGVSNSMMLNVVPRQPAGRVLWRFFMNNQIMLHRPALATDGTIYARSQAGDLIAISPNGELEWFLQLGADLTPQVDIGPDGTIYTADGGPTIYAINPDGTIKWTFDDPFPNQGVIAGPNVGPDGNVYVVTHTPGLGAFSLDPQGNLRWVGPDSGANNPYFPIGQQGQEIVFSNTQLFFCQNGRCDSFDFEGDLIFREFTVTQYSDDSPQPAIGPNGDHYFEEWSLLHSFDSSGNQNWTAFSPPGSNLRDPYVGPDGTIYVMRNVFNTFHALNPDGSTKWTYNHPETLLNPVIDPTDQTIVIGGGSYGNSFYLGLDRSGDPKWQVDLPLEPLTPFETAQAFPQGRARFTPDGSVAYVMASSGSNSGGHCYLYALQVGPSVDVGYGVPGVQGTPRLSVQGTLEPGSPFTVQLQDACPNAPMLMFVGAQAISTPFFDGVLVPRPDLVRWRMSKQEGTFSIAGNWPLDLPSETSLFFQFWIADAVAPSGWSASNAVSLVTP